MPNEQHDRRRIQKRLTLGISDERTLRSKSYERTKKSVRLKLMNSAFPFGLLLVARSGGSRFFNQPHSA